MKANTKARSSAAKSTSGHSNILFCTGAIIGFLLVFSSAVSAAVPKQIVKEIGAPATGETGGLFNMPRGVGVNQTGNGGVPAGTFYVVESENRRIQRFDPTGSFVSAWGVGVDEGNPDYGICTKAENCRTATSNSFDGGNFSFSGAQGLAVDQATGNIYVSDSGFRRIDVFSAKGAFEGAFGFGVINGGAALQFCTLATGCQSPFTGTEPAAPGGRFGTAIGGLAVDTGGNVYVADKTFRRVDVFKPLLSGATVTGVEFVRAFGRDVVTTGKPNNVSTTAFEVCDTTNGNVATDCKTGTTGSEAGNFAGTNRSPADVAVDSAGNIFALDFTNKRVQEFSSAAVPINQEFGAAALSGIFGDGSVPNAAGELLNLAIDPSDDHVFVSGRRSTHAGKIAVAELDHSGLNAVEGGGVHGQELSILESSGLTISKASLGNSIYLSSPSTTILQGVYVLNVRPTITGITGITGTTARLKGEVVSEGIDVAYHFEYSTNDKVWTRVPGADVDAGSQTGKIPVEVEVTGLTGSQLYHVRLVQNRASGGGEATSSEADFTTLAEKPAILGTAAWPVKDTSVTFDAYLDPQNKATTYRFEYGLTDCSVGSCTILPPSEARGAGPRLVTQTVTGLASTTLYHFRLIAINATGETKGEDRIVETFAPGAQLPDNRAYELVTPPDTAAVVLNGASFGSGINGGCFDMFPATANGNSVVSMSRGGSLPGLDVNGRWDFYESVRTADGWTTISNSASIAQTTNAQDGLCVSPDHLYSTLGTDSAAHHDEGSLVVAGKQSNYIRVPGAVANPSCSPEPQGHFELVGCGTLGTDPEANARWLTDGAAHIIFTSKAHLEAAAPSAGIEAIYDRTPGGATRVVSLLPGEVTPGSDAEYQGASTNGSTVAFKIGGTIYARLENAETVQVAAAPNTFAGISQDGERIFYVNAAPSLGVDPAPAGLFVFDLRAQVATEIAPNSVFVNVSEDGSHVYFTSQSALAGAAEAGKDNLYAWDRADEDIRFIAVLDPRDVTGDPSLTRWVNGAVHPRPSVSTGRATDLSRTTPDGSVLLFESRANVTGYDSGGHLEIYRYDTGGDLDCVSCPSAGIRATSDAALQAFPGLGGPASALVHVQNVTDDGQKVFFQTEDALVPTDLNGTWDVYEWKAGQQPYLITSGQGQLPSLLYGMTPSGSDVFFTSTERLVPQDLSTVASIYDAREGGGFLPAQLTPPCQEDNCQGTPSSAPHLSDPSSVFFQGPENERRPPRCGKNERRVRRHGETRCVKKHHRKAPRRRHRASHNRRAVR